MNKYQEWLDAKAAENAAKEKRQKIEDEMLIGWNVDTALEEGTKSFKEDSFKVKITFRQNRKVDADKIREIAIENGSEEHLKSLLRWKAELNKKVWDSSSDEITGPLMAAITTTPGRPSFAIEIIEENKE